MLFLFFFLTFNNFYGIIKIMCVKMCISLKKEKEIFSHLLSLWEKEKRKIAIYIPQEKIKRFPAVYPLGILGVDWAGVLETIISVVHNMNWNICAIYGYTVTLEEKRHFVLTLGIEIGSFEALMRFEQEKRYIKKTVESIATAMEEPKRRVLLDELKKISKLEQTLQFIRKEVGDSLEDALEEEGIKFFSGRPGAYLEERSANDLAKQILATYRMKNRLRNTGGIPEVNIDTFKTTKGSWTGISVAAFLRDFSLADCISAIEKEFPGSPIVYSNEFITYDGIANYRIELEGMKSKANLKKTIESMIKIGGKKRSVLFEKEGGIEQYARIIIPYLLKEFSVSNIPQVLIMPLAYTKEMVSLKLIIVHKDGEVKDIVQRLHKKHKFSIKGIQPTREMGKAKLDLMEIELSGDLFETKEEIYPKIKSIIGEVIGKFRDFNETTRIRDIEKLKEVERIIISKIEQDFIRRIYYCLEDFMRANLSVSEIISFVKLGYSLYEKALKDPAKTHLARRESKHKYTLICISTTKDIFTDIVALISFNLTSSSTNIGNTYIHFFMVKKDGLPLPESIVRKLMRSIRRL